MHNPDQATDSSQIEVELKFRLADVAELECQLARLGAKEGSLERHSDTYYRHPARDFAQTREALRIRRVVSQPAPSGDADDHHRGERSTTLVTYKGPPAAAEVKSRPELQWRLDPCDPDGANLAQLLELLGFSQSLTVGKTRRSFALTHSDLELTVTIDAADDLGMFTEIETLASNPQQATACAAVVRALAEQLGLREVEKRSYLQMTIEATASHRRG
jgi:adenylate cyclase, class 2